MSKEKPGGDREGERARYRVRLQGFIGDEEVGSGGIPGNRDGLTKRSERRDHDLTRVYRGILHLQVSWSLYNGALWRFGDQ